MSSFIEATGKKLFAKHLEKYTPEDPLYEFYTNKHGKQKRRKVKLSFFKKFTPPPSLSNHEGLCSANYHLVSLLVMRLSSAL
jgi:hypothetical protein